MVPAAIPAFLLLRHFAQGLVFLESRSNAGVGSSECLGRVIPHEMHAGLYCRGDLENAQHPAWTYLSTGNREFILHAQKVRDASEQDCRWKDLNPHRRSAILPGSPSKRRVGGEEQGANITRKGRGALNSITYVRAMIPITENKSF